MLEQYLYNNISTVKVLEKILYNLKHFDQNLTLYVWVLLSGKQFHFDRKTVKIQNIINLYNYSFILTLFRTNHYCSCSIY